MYQLTFINSIVDTFLLALYYTNRSHIHIYTCIFLSLYIPFQGNEGMGHIRLYKDIATTSCADSLPSNVAL